jgi:hypothetical protein
MQARAELGEVLVSAGDCHPEDNQDDGRRHIALRHPAYAAGHTNWAESMEGNAVANPCQATEPAEKGVARRGGAFVNLSATFQATGWSSGFADNCWTRWRAADGAPEGRRRSGSPREARTLMKAPPARALSLATGLTTGARPQPLGLPRPADVRPRPRIVGARPIYAAVNRVRSRRPSIADRKTGRGTLETPRASANEGSIPAR